MITVSKNINFTLDNELQKYFGKVSELDDRFSNRSECLRFLIRNYINIQTGTNQKFEKENNLQVKKIELFEIKDRLNKCFLEKVNKKYSSLDLAINFESYKKSDFESLLNKNKVKNKEKILYDIALTNTSRDFLKVPVLKINDYENVKREITYMENLGAISSDLDELDKSKIEDIFSNNIFLLPHDKIIIYDKRDNGEVYIFLSLKNIIFDFLDLNKKQYTFLKDILKLNTVKIDKKVEVINTVNKFNVKSTPEYYQRFILVDNLKSKIIVYIFEAQNKKDLLSTSNTISDLHQILIE